MLVRRLVHGVFISAVLLLHGHEPAHAGALLEPPGNGEIITTTSFSKSTRAFAANGRLIAVPAYEKFELATYVEYGLSEHVTLVARPAFRSIPVGMAEPRAAASADLGARLGLFDLAGTFFSLQETMHLPTSAHVQQTYLLDEANIFANRLDLLATRNLTLANCEAFVDGAIGYRWQSRGLPGEWHAGLTLGLRSQPNILWLVQSFATLSDGAAAFGTYGWLKVEASVVYDLDPGFSLQLGLFESLIGRNTGRELGPLAGLWYRF